MGYFNYQAQFISSAWELMEYWGKWHKLYATDRQWVPPHYPTLKRTTHPRQTSPHWKRMKSAFVVVEALPKPTRHRSQQADTQSVSLTTSFERPLLATAVSIDPRRIDHTATFSLFHCANDPYSIRFWLDKMKELLRQQQCRRLIGPVGISPYMGSGVLINQWHRLPPLHTPYNPPYLPEIMTRYFRPLAQTRLFHLPVQQPPTQSLANSVSIRPFSPTQLMTTLLPLLIQSMPQQDQFPPLDADEAAFLQRWLGKPAPFGWAAYVDRQPVGFVLLQADVSRQMRQAGGSRRLWQRPLWAWLNGRPTKHGRLLFGTVHPHFRGQGIGTHLMRQAMQAAQAHRWETLIIGPLGEQDTAVTFLQKFNARPEQSYQLYEYSL